MSTQEEISIREYLRQQARKGKDIPYIEQYDDFLDKIALFFRLRVEAEDYFTHNLHVAKSKHGALPIDWASVKQTLDSTDPPEQLITIIAKRYYANINALLGNLRKVLSRIRQKVAIGRVQQVDSHCLRWLERQPGWTIAEKGGPRQEILGIVRIENYNTLENRVLKDFLSRCVGLATLYLRNYDKDGFHEHFNIQSVRHLRNLCLLGLDLPELRNVQNILEYPQPNYVLQQDCLYSQIWRMYSDILYQADVAENLWERRDEINELYRKCLDGIPIHCSPRAKYHTPLWICEMDGRKPIFEFPIWKNELLAYDLPPSSPPYDCLIEGEVFVVDFLFPWDNRDELVYPSNHPNAYPFLQDKRHPSLEPGANISLQKILNEEDKNNLQEYFRQLWGNVGGKRWIVLVPDHWNAFWLESIIQAKPASLPRNKIFLLWRSIAASLGVMERQTFIERSTLVVTDGFNATNYNAVSIRFILERQTGRILPQRSSPQLHASNNANDREIRFYFNQSYLINCKAPFVLGQNSSTILDMMMNPQSRESIYRIAVGSIKEKHFPVYAGQMSYYPTDDLLLEGVMRFLREDALNLISYFDELDQLSLVIQTRSEDIEFKTLVHHNECSHGGKAYNGEKIKGATLKQGESMLLLNLLEGPPADDTELKTLEYEFDQRSQESQDIYFQATIIPGQGLATVMLFADFLDKPIPLDLTQMKTDGKTKAIIERNLKRHFPPIMPHVEANIKLWDKVVDDINYYLISGNLFGRNDLFAQAQSFLGAKYNPKKHSPIDLLKRKNVFGNAPGNELPIKNFPWEILFNRLAEDYRHDESFLRMIAWTYQSHAKEFDFIRDYCFTKYVINKERLNDVESTFCANCFSPDDKRLVKILNTAFSRIIRNDAKQQEYRLTYNIMQFYPGILKEIETPKCEEFFKNIYEQYNIVESSSKGYLLKCMLFLLHRRRYDEYFLKMDDNWQPSGLLAQKIEKSYGAKTDEKTRLALIDYLRGCGTIEGIPLGDD